MQPPNSAPARADIVIIGAGIQGCASAYYMAKRGLKVVLLDKSRVAGQQSSRAWGFVRVQMRDPDEIPMMLAAKKIWRGLEAELGADLEWCEAGALYLADDEVSLAGKVGWLAKVGEFGLDSRILTPAEVAGLMPRLTAPNRGAIYTPSDGHAEPRKAAPAFARRAREFGAVILEGCGALGISLEGGRVAGVETEAGPVRSPMVLLCAGASSWRILRGIGISLPQQHVRASVARTNALPDLGRQAFVGSGVGFRQRPDGTLYLAHSLTGDVDVTLDNFRDLKWYLQAVRSTSKGLSFHVNGALVSDLARRLPWDEAAQKPAIHVRDPDIPPNRASLAKAVAKLGRAFPGLGHVGLTELWAGHIDTLPDGIPVIDAPANPAGLLIATGFCGHGFALGPVVGQMMLGLATEGRLPAELANLSLRPFRLSRFAEGDVKPPYSIW